MPRPTAGMLVFSSNSQFPESRSAEGVVETSGARITFKWEWHIAGSSQIARMVKLFKIVLNDQADGNEVRDRLYV